MPQLDEVIERYAVDGIWVDGDNWAAYPDCSDEGLAAFARASGIQLTRDRVPQAPGDPHWFAFMEFWRERFREYVRGYVTELHRRHPGVQITSNHACSAIMPEAPAIDLDYLSADYYHKNSVYIARLEARVLAGQGRPWDLMPWGHSGPPLGEEGAHSTKSAVQVQQEAAHVIAQGGGIQCYFPQKPDGSLAVWQAGLMERLARFCRLRERHCFRSRTVPQVALLHSTFDYYRRTGALFMGVDRFGHWYGELLRVHGALAALLDNQLSVDVLVEERLEPRLDALRSGRTVPARPHRRAARLHRRGRAPPVSRAAGGGAGLACGRRGGATDGRRAQGPPAQHRRPARRPAGSRLRRVAAAGAADRVDPAAECARSRQPGSAGRRAAVRLRRGETDRHRTAADRPRLRRTTSRR